MPELFKNLHELVTPAVIFLYFLIINIAGFIVIKADKRRAIKKKYRIPEKIIFLFAFSGGGIGVYFSMFRYRHKTLHKRFILGIPFISLIQFVIIIKLILL